MSMDTRGQYHLRALTPPGASRAADRVAGSVLDGLLVAPILATGGSRAPLAPAIQRGVANTPAPVERPDPATAAIAPPGTPGPAATPATDPAGAGALDLLKRLRCGAASLAEGVAAPFEGMAHDMEHRAKVRVAIAVVGVVSALGLVIVLSRLSDP